MKKTILQFSAIVASMTGGLLGCGGGGGGSDSGPFFGAANVDVRTTPSRIDSGDRTQVSIELSDVHENGIAVKIRFPAGLRYVPGSSFLTVDDKKIDVDPTIVQTDSAEDLSYVVTYLTQNQFRRSNEEYQGEPGTLLIQLEGRKSVVNGEIEVDPDVDDPAESNDTEFDIANPEFAAESSASIEVIAQ